MYIDILLGIFTDVQRGSKASTTIIELVLKHEVTLFWKELAKKKKQLENLLKILGNPMPWGSMMEYVPTMNGLNLS